LRPWSGIGIALLLAACGNADNPYSRLADPPLVPGRLHTVTLVSDTRAIVDAITAVGWQAAQLPPNYPRADAVQASLWSVPQPVAAAVLHFSARKPGSPDLRLLVMPLAARGRVAKPAENEAFFRNVLGADVPVWPLPAPPPANVRVQVWTYLVPSIIEASKRLRANGIPVIYDPVAITTAYLGDHKTLAIRAPDGTVVQLVETASR
jgi:hypothetical protein